MRYPRAGFIKPRLGVYEADLDRNLTDLHERVHRGAYRALPSRRTYIAKADGKQRPLAVAALEDKIVQRATVAVLNAIYEEDFLGLSYGFRPKRGQHDALDALVVGITSRRVNFILTQMWPPFLTQSAKTGWCDLWGAVAELVGNEGGVVSGVINLESSGVSAPDWRPRHDEHYHEARFFAACSRDGC